MSTPLTYLIAGCGVAGITAAQEIRRLDGRGRILLIGDEPYYYRGSLSDWLAGRMTDEMLPARTPAFYNQMALDRIPGRIAQVDPDAHQVALDDGRLLAYDRLLLATGARANQIDIPGLAPEDTGVLRSWADARALVERVGCCGRALILGGGVLGLELAGALVEMGGKQVAIVQRSAYVGPPLLDAPAADWLQARIHAAGVDLFLEDTVAEVKDHRALLQSGREWVFDLLVQSIGVRPVFPPVPGLEVGRGIRIGPAGRTNLADIYAAGDCTETLVPGSDRWAPTRTWLESARQGRVAGHNMAGGKGAVLTQVPFYNASVLFDTMYSYIGDPYGKGPVHHWETPGAYRHLRLHEGRLAGALLLGDRRGSQAICRAIGQEVARYGEALARPDFPWNDLTGLDWDYDFY